MWDTGPTSFFCKCLPSFSIQFVTFLYNTFYFCKFGSNAPLHVWFESYFFLSLFKLKVLRIYYCALVVHSYLLMYSVYYMDVAQLVDVGLFPVPKCSEEGFCEHWLIGLGVNTMFYFLSGCLRMKLLNGMVSVCWT